MITTVTESSRRRSTRQAKQSPIVTEQQSRRKRTRAEEDEDESGDHSIETLAEERPTIPTNNVQSAHTCPHCQKHFTVEYGLRYHVDNYVCRPDERPGGPKKKGRRKREDNNNNSKYKRLRGSLEDRTCPKCNRVFTSTIGLDYHLGK